jgi:predicted nucleic acid-binding protein
MTHAGKRIFLDTNVVLAIMFNQKAAVDKLADFANYQFCISRLVYVEIFAGAHLKDKPDTHKFLNRFIVLPFSEKGQKQAVNLSRLFFIGRERKPYDLLIAAHAIGEQIPIITKNVKYFEIYPEIKLFNFSTGKWVKN